MSASLIYSNIYLYRLVMNVLYAGGYRQRFTDVVDQLGDARSVCDLCFGDTIVAAHCRSRGVQWTGVDLNPGFCRRARRLGFTVLEGDLFTIDAPPADVFVMIGSLYHFHDRLAELLDVVAQRTRRFIISEPVRNLSSQPGLVGWWARRSADPGDGHAAFRYDETALPRALNALAPRHDFTVRTISVRRDMLVVVEWPARSA